MKIPAVVIGVQAEGSSWAVVEDVKGHLCAVTGHQARDRQNLRRHTSGAASSLPVAEPKQAVGHETKTKS